MKHKKLTTAVILWIMISVIVMIFISYRGTGNMADRQTFMKQVSVGQTENKVGALVKLKEAIHGTEGITYRYIVKTDCDKWNFESRYVSKKPLAWVDGKTSAAEVLIYSIQIRYEGTIYANGTYYTVPILEDLSSENIPFEEWKQNLVKQAYQAYESDVRPDKRNIILIAILLSVAGAVLLHFMNRLDDKAAKLQQESSRNKPDKEHPDVDIVKHQDQKPW